MAKLLMLSVVIMMVALPVIASRDRSGRRGLRKTLYLALLFNLFYLFAMRFIYPRL